MMRLSLEDEAGNVRVIPLTSEELTIGRAEDNHLVLGDRNVSRHHARLRLEGGRCLLSDAGSRYGIRMGDGLLRGETSLSPGQVFQIGDFRLKVLPDDDALSEEGAEDVTPLATPSLSNKTQRLESMPAAPEGDRFWDVRELEAAAREGIPSDFYDEPAERRQVWRYLLALLVLLIVAGGLAFAYYRLYLSDEGPTLGAIPTTSSPPRNEPPLSPEPRPVPRQETPMAPREEVPKTPAAEARGTTDAPPSTRTERPSRPDPVPSRPVAPETRSSRTAEAPQRVVKEPSSPTTKPASTEAPPAAVESAADAAFQRAKREGDAFVGAGETEKAIEKYREALRLTKDPGKKEALKRRIQGLGGTVE